MDRVAVFIDAGYLFAQGSQELWGATLRKLDFSKVLAHPDHDERLRQVAEYNAGEVPFADVPALVNQIRSTNQRPPQIDGKLLAMSRRALGGCDLDSKQKQAVRAAFLDALAKRFGE